MTTPADSNLTRSSNAQLAAETASRRGGRETYPASGPSPTPKTSGAPSRNACGRSRRTSGTTAHFALMPGCTSAADLNGFMTWG